jgi:hypothetical protein
MYTQKRACTHTHTHTHTVRARARARARTHRCLTEFQHTQVSDRIYNAILHIFFIFFYTQLCLIEFTTPFYTFYFFHTQLSDRIYNAILHIFFMFSTRSCLIEFTTPLLALRWWMASSRLKTHPLYIVNGLGFQGLEFRSRI